MNNVSTKMKHYRIKLNFFLTQLKRYWIIILIASIIAGAIGGVIGRIVYKPEYTTTQAFTINVKSRPDASIASTSETQLSKTIPSLMTSEAFMKYMSPYIKESGADGRFMVSSLSSTNIFYITAVAPSNKDCVTIINTIQQNSSYMMSKIIGESEMELLAVPSTSKLPSNSPKYIQYALVCFALVLMLSLALLIFRAGVTKTFNDANDAEKELNSKCLAVIDEINKKRRSSDKSRANKMPLVTDEGASLELKQSINTLATKVIKKCRDNDYKTILVTSTISGEGKTSISTNLACDIADIGHKVLLIDCDLRTPNVIKAFDIEASENKLSNAIANVDNSKDYIIKTGVMGLDLLCNTSTTDNAIEAANGNELKNVINKLKNEYDYIILDTPPVGFLGDSISISDVADAFIYVISHNFVNVGYVKRSLGIFNNSDSEMLGFVINHKK